MSARMDGLRPAILSALLAMGAVLVPCSAMAEDYDKTEVIVYHDDASAWVMGQVETVTDVETGRVISQTEYGWNHLPVKQYSFGRLVQEIGYNTADGTVAHVKDGAGHTTTVGGWKRGIPQSITYADSTSQSAVVSNDGTLASVTDANGNKTCYAYDAMGRLSQVTYTSESAAGVCDTSAWAPTTQVFEQIDVSEGGIPAGHWRQIVKTGSGQKTTYYDGLWRPLLVQEHHLGNYDATKRFTRFAYDHDGRTVFASYPSSAYNTAVGTYTEYDVLGRPLRIEQDSELGAPLVTTTWYGNNADGDYSKVTNPRGQITRTWHQNFDQPGMDAPTTIWHPEGAFTHIPRDDFGKPTRIRRSNSASLTGGTVAIDREYFYNAQQQLCRVKEPETGDTFMGYDAAGNLAWSAAGYRSAAAACVEATAVAARRADRGYDLRNRIVSLSFPDGRGNTTHTYTADGLPETITVNNDGGTGQIVTTSYAYNRRRLPVQERMQWGSVDWTLGYGYNANGHLASQVYPDGTSVDYAPNALGQPTQAGSYASNVSYFPNGAIKQFTYGNGIVHTLTQNARGLPDISTDAYSGTAFLADSYDYDANGNVAAITDGATGTGQRGNRDMVYDGLDRLTGTTSPMFGTATYAYDVLDNLTRLSVSGGTAARDHYYCYDANWQLTNIKTGSCSGTTVVGLGYDAQGNLANKSGANFDFDYGNRLRGASGIGVTASGYVYDGLGRRVRDVTSGSKYSLYSQSGQLAFASDLRKGTQHVYIYLGGSLVGVRDKVTATGAVSVKYQHTDALGSPVVITDANRTELERREYEPYGKQLTPTPQDGPGYTGHVFDAATGLVYAQQRYYDDDIGRFLSADPVTVDGDTGGNFNRYQYVRNDPYSRVDPDGERDIYIGGASDKDGSKIVENFADARKGKPPGRDVQYFGWHQRKEIQAAIAAPLSEGEPLNIIGHSLGGREAIWQANNTSALISNMVTVDPVGASGDGSKPLNVSSWTNVIAKAGRIHRSDLVAYAGRRLEGVTNTSGADNLVVSSASHGDFSKMMQDAAVIQVINASYIDTAASAAGPGGNASSLDFDP
ncbi:RHS repeat domain-containing protein [Marilutibacter maris]|uniref:Type IV secretion protein Rhs n=1 Tax=Marilutibacter maris TaxID=1605891 RepID=A0A2U9T930_9GAMM|nr:RHS repeat-associated core domain-containing protein [Lysobacter maris]AWV08082.1 type IV secretion protein Rhs [Lysobacter maris]